MKAKLSSISNFEYKKSPYPCNLQGQKLMLLRYHPVWCIKTPSHFAYHHMHPTDNGQGSRKRILSIDFWLPSQVHSVTPL